MRGEIDMRRDGNKMASSRGFTLLEAMIALAILAFGILGLAAMMTDGIAYMNMSQADFIAQQKAEEAVESIFFARDSKNYSWAQLQNVADGGIFMNAPEALLSPGPDGIIDTADDLVAPVPDVIFAPGPSGILGAADSIKMPLSNYTRQIVITNVLGNPDLREIQVIMVYTAGRFQRRYVLTSYISRFS
jgi:prepilin-type N-terminal cleavage/methylation domain-containing protein